jgi:hypothetical protein
MNWFSPFPFTRPYRRAILTLNQHSLGKIEPFLELGQLGGLAGEAILGFFQGGRLLLQPVSEMGKVGLRRSPAADGHGYRPCHHDDGGPDDREPKQKNSLSHESASPVG